MQLAYHKNVPVGTEERLPSGALVRYVEPEQFFPAMLACRTNASTVFLATVTPAGRVPEERLPAVDDAIAAAYWKAYHGCLMPPRILRALSYAATGRSSGLFLELLESVRRSLFAAENLAAAADLHAASRVQLLLRGVDRYLTEEQVTVGEMLADYFMLQRAVAEDVRRAEAERGPGTPRCKVIERYDKTGDLEYERTVGVVLRSQQKIADLLPPNRRADVETFARHRQPVIRAEGILAVVEGSTGQ